MAKTKKIHSVLTSADLENEGQLANVMKYLKSENFTPTEYRNLLTNTYSNSGNDHEDLISQYGPHLKDHPFNTPANNDKIYDQLDAKLKNTNEDDDYWDKRKAESAMEHLKLSPEKITQIIKDQKRPDKDGIKNKPDIYDLHNQPSFNSKHLSDIISNPGRNVTTGMVTHPAMTDNLFDRMLGSNSHNLKNLPSGTLDSPHMNEARAAKILQHSSPISSYDHNKLLEKLPEERRKAYVEANLGMTGGKPQVSNDKESAPYSDDELNYNNWTPGKHFNEENAKELASSKHLTPEAIDHIKRNGSFDQKFNLFENPNVDPKHAIEMLNNWHNDDEDKGYAKQDFRDRMEKEHNDDMWDDYSDDAREQAQEDYPMSEYLKNNFNDDDLSQAYFDKPHEDWKTDHLNEKYDWHGKNPNHDPKADPNEDPANYEPENIDFANHSNSIGIEDHPEYEKRSNEADDAFKQAINGEDTPDQLYDGYDESLHDDISNNVQQAYDADLDDATSNENWMPKHVSDAIKAPWNKEDPNVTPEQLKAGLDHPHHMVQEAAIDHPNITPDLINHVLSGNHPNNDRHDDHFSEKVKEKAQQIRDQKFPVSENTVGVKLGTHPLRQLRDYIDQNGGTMKKQDFKAAGVNTASIDKLFGPKGTITSKDVQNHIDQVPATVYNSSIADWDGAQRHSGEKQNVFQLNYTQDQLEKMKQAGVLGTFQKLQDHTFSSGHPVKRNTLGWVRYTGNPGEGFHLDEVQTDLGQSLIKKAAQQAKEAVRNGAITPEQAETALENAKDRFPDEHLNKIQEIAFNGKHPSEVLHEAFKEHMRQKGLGDTPIHIWQPESKAPISGQTQVTQIDPANLDSTIDSLKEGNAHTDGKALLAWGKKNKIIPASHKDITPGHLDQLKESYKKFHEDHATANNGEAPKLAVPLPVHMQEGYGKIPKAMKYTEGKYGELPTQNSPEYQGQPTYKDFVRKAESEPSIISDATKAQLAQTLQNLDQNKMLIEQLRSQAPDVYNAIAEMIQSLMSTMKAADINPDELQTQEQPQDPNAQPQQEQSQGANFSGKKDQPITHGKKVYAPGSERTYGPGNEKIKKPDGSWQSINTMNNADEGSQGQPLQQSEKSLKKSKFPSSMNNKQMATHWMKMAYGQANPDDVNSYKEDFDNDGHTKWVLHSIPVDQIHPHHTGHDATTSYIQDYAKQRQGGSEFPPIIAKPHPEKPDHFITVDGMHRLQAAKQLGQSHISAYLPVKSK